MKEFIITIGPVSFLRVGRVWSFDLTDSFGFWGIGLQRIGWRRIKP